MTDLKDVFFLVGPTATGKSEIAADVAQELDAEIVNADAFQIYRGVDLLTAKPEPKMLARAPHHLIGAVSTSEEMNAERFRLLAMDAISEIRSHEKLALVVGGSGLYVRALTHGLTSLPKANPQLRAQLNALSLDQLRQKLMVLDPGKASTIDLRNRRRIIPAIEICLATTQRPHLDLLSAPPSHEPGEDAMRQGKVSGFFIFRDREELYRRINRRVEEMFEQGVVDEVRAGGPISTTAMQMIGLREIQQLIENKISKSQCIALIQQATRRYAKRQLTWFRHQTSFQTLNLSLLSHQEAVKWILQKAPSRRCARE